MKYQHTFDKTTLQAVGGPLDGEYYGMPWPCWGTPEMKHPGTPNLYDTSKPVAEGGLCFRARFGVERDGENLLAEGSYPVGSEIKDGYPQFTMGMLKDLGWDKDLTTDERNFIEGLAGDKTNWKTDLTGGIQRVAIKLVAHHLVMLKQELLYGHFQIQFQSTESHYTLTDVT